MESLAVESWKPVVGFESLYEVSNLGNVRRKDTKRIRKQSFGPSGYLFIALSRSPGLHQRSVHRMVAEAFLGPIDKGKHVNHKNMVKTDNRLDNLEIVTVKENVRHAIAHRAPVNGDYDVKMRKNDRLISSGEASKELGISKSTLGYWLAKLKIKPACEFQFGITYWLRDIRRARRIRYAALRP